MFFTLTSIQALIIDTDDFRTDPQLLIDIVQSLDLVLNVILVTRSNRPHDHFLNRTTQPRNTTEHLRFPALLKRIMREAQLPPTSTVFLCGSRHSLELAKPLLLGTVVFRKKTNLDEEKLLLYQESPDFVVDSLESLLQCLSCDDKGFMAEVASSPNRSIKSLYKYSPPTLIDPENSAADKSSKVTSQVTPVNTDSRSYKTPLNTAADPSTSTSTSTSTSASTSGNASASTSASTSGNTPAESETRIIQLPNLEYPDCPYFVMGRYFGPADPRHQIHALSLRILKFKRHHAPHLDLFARLYEEGIADATDATHGAHDLVTQVPSRPEVGDRLAYLLTKLRANSTKPDSIQTDVLRCVKTYPSLKGLNLHARKTNVANVFRVQKDVAGKRIILIDDVITTGATVNACIKELKSAGAKSVSCVFLAYHPFALRAYSFRPLSCTVCDEPVDVTFEHPSEICFECHNGRDSETVHSRFSFDDVLASRVFSA